MFLTVLAFSMVVVFMMLIMTKRLSAMVALILVPTATAIIGGFGAEMGPMMLDGIRTIAPTAIMLMFAILFFGIMIDAGLFDPLVNKIVQLVDGDPVKVCVGTCALSLAVALDGDGATTYMVAVAAMMPLYVRLGMNTLAMAAIIMMSTSVMNVLPWGGPAGRVASSLGIDVGQMFLPMIPAMIGCAMGVMGIAYRLGLNERKRLGKLAVQPLPQSGAGRGVAVAEAALPASLRDVEAAYAVAAGTPLDPDDGLAGLELRDPTGDPAFTAFAGESPEDIGDRKPQFLLVNFVLTVSLMVALLMDLLPLPALFMIAFAIALMINYRQLDQQRERIAAHAPNALAVSGLIFAAGIFTGILTGTKMVDAMANAAISIIPESMGPYMAVVAGLLSIPGTFFISYDAFYFGVMPVVAQAGATYGVDATEIGRASLIGAPVHALSPLTASTYLLIGLAKIELGDHQRFAFKWTLLMAMLGLVLLLLTGAVSLVGGAP